MDQFNSDDYAAAGHSLGRFKFLALEKKFSQQRQH
jgi:hypothetical protein